MNKEREKAAATLRGVSRQLAPRGWLRATSGNLSLRDPHSNIIYITRSGADKQRLCSADVIGVALDGTLVVGQGAPSFETAIHRALYKATNAEAVFHVHSVYNNVAAHYARNGELIFKDHEMIKALGHWDENAQVAIPVIPNFADINRIANIVTAVVNPQVPAILVERHGVYAFGKTVGDALRHLEALEFLFEWLCWEGLTQIAQHVDDPHFAQNFL